MDVIGALTRPAMSWIFIQGGLDAIRTPGPRATIASDLFDKVRKAAPDSVADRLPDDVTLVQINAGVQIAAGATLALGIAPRLSALALAGSLAPTTLGGHPFWRHADAARGQQRIQFAKNVAIIGGLLLAATRKRS